MADGPTVVTTGGGGGTVAAIIVALIALVVILFLTGVIDFGSGAATKNVDVDVNLPKVEAPTAPVAPAN
jgi:hypothetical protein